MAPAQDAGAGGADPVVSALRALVPGEVSWGETRLAGRALRWVEAGSGEPAVVLDAGLGEPGTLAWAGVLPALAARTRVVAYDRAGIGASDPASPLTAGSAVGDLEAIAEAAGGGRCVLAGHSWGGLLTQVVALHRPDLVAGLVLVDPVHEEVMAEAPAWFRAAQYSYGLVPMTLRPFGLQERLVRWVYQPFAGRVADGSRAQSLILDAYVCCYRAPTQVRAIHQENLLAFGSVEEFRQLRLGRRLPQVPVTVLSASRGLPARLRRPWTRVQAALAEPVGGTHVVVDSGHSIHQERPEIVTDAILGVVDQVRPR